MAFTPGNDGDSPALTELPDQTPEDEEIGRVTADRAYVSTEGNLLGLSR